MIGAAAGVPILIALTLWLIYTHRLQAFEYDVIYHFSLRFMRRNAKKRERAIHVLIIPYREAWHADTDSH
jgi:hypothetical protein